MLNREKFSKRLYILTNVFYATYITKHLFTLYVQINNNGGQLKYPNIEAYIYIY